MIIKRHGEKFGFSLAVFCFFDEIKGKLKISLEMDKIWVYNQVYF